MGLSSDRIAALAGQAQDLSAQYAQPWLDTLLDGREVRAIVAHTIVADDCYRKPATGCRVVDRRVPAICAAHMVDNAAGRGHKEAADRTEDVGGRVIVVVLAVAVAGGDNWEAVKCCQLSFIKDGRGAWAWQYWAGLTRWRTRR